MTFVRRSFREHSFIPFNRNHMIAKHFYSALVGIIGAGLLFLPATAGAESRSEANSFGIVPKPFSIEARKEKPFVINADTSIVYQNEASKPAAEYLRDLTDNGANPKST